MHLFQKIGAGVGEHERGGPFRQAGSTSAPQMTLTFSPWAPQDTVYFLQDCVPRPLSDSALHPEGVLGTRKGGSLGRVTAQGQGRAEGWLSGSLEFPAPGAFQTERPELTRADTQWNLPPNSRGRLAG